MVVVPVALAGRSYEVRIGAGLLGDIAGQTQALLRKAAVPIVTDHTVYAIWGARIEHSLRAAGRQPHWHIVAPGEGSKSWHALAALLDWALALGLERGDHILALGGGVIGDLTGFAAAILKRGCGFIQLPTTLLAQVDSSVGGKTAINTSAGKNLVGAFHQPALVLADLETLQSLPARELRAGYAEVVKYGVLGDPDFFAWCESNGPALLDGDLALREYAVARSVAAKARIVAADERETTGTRALLNLGHTFGHALEAETGFSNRLLHGEAVGLGIVLAARYSSTRGLIDHAAADRVERVLANAGLPTCLAALALTCDGKTLVEHMLHDKKMDAGTLPFILMRAIGQAFVAKDVVLTEVATFLDRELAHVRPLAPVPAGL